MPKVLFNATRGRRGELEANAGVMEVIAYFSGEKEPRRTIPIRKGAMSELFSLILQEKEAIGPNYRMR